jgi:hypothetical protein
MFYRSYSLLVAVGEKIAGVIHFPGRFLRLSQVREFSTALQIALEPARAQ